MIINEAGSKTRKRAGVWPRAGAGAGAGGGVLPKAGAGVWLRAGVGLLEQGQEDTA